MDNRGPTMTVAEITEWMNTIAHSVTTPQIVATQVTPKKLRWPSGALDCWLELEEDGTGTSEADPLETKYQLKYLKKQIIETTHDIDHLMHAVDAHPLTPDTIRSLISAMQKDISVLYNLTGTFSCNVYQAIQDAPNE